jgi:hypothetical protein
MLMIRCTVLAVRCLPCGRLIVEDKFVMTDDSVEKIHAYRTVIVNMLLSAHRGCHPIFKWEKVYSVKA